MDKIAPKTGSLIDLKKPIQATSPLTTWEHAQSKLTWLARVGVGIKLSGKVTPQPHFSSIRGCSKSAARRDVTTEVSEVTLAFQPKVRLRTPNRNLFYRSIEARHPIQVSRLLKPGT